MDSMKVRHEAIVTAFYNYSSQYFYDNVEGTSTLTEEGIRKLNVLENTIKDMKNGIQ